MGKGSLGEVLPASVRGRFISAAVAIADDRPVRAIESIAPAPAAMDDFGAFA